MDALIFEEHGYFWWNDEVLPDNHVAPDSAVPGVLTINSVGKISLELNGLLTKGHPLSVIFGEENLNDNTMIQGALKGSESYILLSGVHRNGGNFVSRGISYQGFLADNCLVSKIRFPSAQKKIAFFGFEVELAGLEDWVDLKSIKASRNVRRLNASYRAPKESAYKVTDGILVIRHDLLGPSFGERSHRNLELHEKSYIVLKLRKMVSLEAVRDQYCRLEDFLIILAGCNISLEWPVVKLGGHRVPCTYYYHRNKSAFTPPKRHDICVRHKNVSGDFGVIFDAWKIKREQFGPGFYLYLGAFRATKTYIENKYVNLIWGLESLHRRTLGSLEVDNKLQTKIERILDKHSGGDRKWLAGRLKNAGEPSLEERLFGVFSRLTIGLDKVTLRSFCKDCADRRNDISHFGGQRHDSSYKDFLHELRIKSEALSRLYHAVILQEIGVRAEHIYWWFHEGTCSYQLKNTLSDAGLVLSKQRSGDSS